MFFSFADWLVGSRGCGREKEEEEERGYTSLASDRKKNAHTYTHAHTHTHRLTAGIRTSFGGAGRGGDRCGGDEVVQEQRQLASGVVRALELSRSVLLARAGIFVALGWSRSHVHGREQKEGKTKGPIEDSGFRGERRTRERQIKDRVHTEFILTKTRC